MRTALLALGCAGWLVILAAPQASAQTTYGSLEGFVRDTSGAVARGATVTLRHQETGIERIATSDTEGRYRFVNLPPGPYAITVTNDGFKTVVRTDVTVRAGEQTPLDITIEVGAMAETVTVRAAAPDIQTTTSHLSTVVGAKTVTELPLIGRNFANLAFLAPGVVQDNQGGIGQFSVNGQRSTTNTFTVDGTDVNNPYWNVLQGGALGGGSAFASIDGISEVRVQTSTFSAEYGRQSGAIVTAVTKSGTNQFRGSAFDFARDDRWAATDYFVQVAGATKPPLDYQNFGGSVGGPIKRNRMFFFFLYEGQRQSRSGFFSAIVPSERILQLAVPSIQPLTRFVPQPTGAEFRNADGSPTGLAPLDMATIDDRDENNYQARVDGQLTGKDSMFFRGTLSKGTRTQVNQSHGPHLPFVNGYTIMSGTLVHTHIFSSRVFNEFRFGTNRQDTPFASANGNRDVLAFDSVGRPTNPRFSVAGTTISIYGGLGPVVQVTNVFQFTDNVSVVAGAHTMRFGFDIRRTQIKQENNQTWYGSYTFSSVQNFITNNPVSFLAIRGRATYPRLANYSFYAQDDYKIRPTLTLNLGLRYEINTPIGEANDNVTNLRPFDNLSIAQISPGPGYSTDRNNFAPRVGFAWDVRGDQRSVIRGGWGLYYDVGPGNWGPLALVTNPPTQFNPFLSGALAQYPVPGELITPSRAQASAVTVVPPDVPTSYTMHGNLTYQRVLPWGFTGTASYVRSQGFNLYRLRPGNLRQPLGTGQVINPGFSQINISENAAKSWYNALELTAERVYRSGLEIRASYTYGKATDDSSGYAFYSASPSVASNPFDLAADLGPSGFDVRHNVIASYIYELPVKALFGGRGPAALVDGWQLSGIFQARSGLPYTVLIGFDNAGVGLTGSFSPQRPNVVAGQSFYLGDRVGPDYRLNRAAFATPPAGTFGDLGRNTFRGAPFVNSDFGLSKYRALRCQQVGAVPRRGLQSLQQPELGAALRHEHAGHAGGAIRVGDICDESAPRGPVWRETLLLAGLRPCEGVGPHRLRGAAAGLPVRSLAAAVRRRSRGALAGLVPGWAAHRVRPPRHLLHVWRRQPGQSVDRLTTDGSSDPKWSPDGRLIAYCVQAQLRVIAPDGTGQRVLVSTRLNAEIARGAERSRPLRALTRRSRAFSPRSPTARGNCAELDERFGFVGAAKETIVAASVHENPARAENPRRWQVGCERQAGGQSVCSHTEPVDPQRHGRFARARQRKLLIALDGRRRAGADRMRDPAAKCHEQLLDPDSKRSQRQNADNHLDEPKPGRRIDIHLNVGRVERDHFVPRPSIRRQARHDLHAVGDCAFRSTRASPDLQIAAWWTQGEGIQRRPGLHGRRPRVEKRLHEHHRKLSWMNRIRHAVRAEKVAQRRCVAG